MIPLYPTSNWDYHYKIIHTYKNLFFNESNTFKPTLQMSPSTKFSLLKYYCQKANNSLKWRARVAQ